MITIRLRFPTVAGSLLAAVGGLGLAPSYARHITRANLVRPYPPLGFGNALFFGNIKAVPLSGIWGDGQRAESVKVQVRAEIYNSWDGDRHTVGSQELAVFAVDEILKQR